MFYLGYAAGFSEGVAFVCGVLVTILAALYVAYCATNGWAWWRK